MTYFVIIFLLNLRNKKLNFNYS